MPLLVLKGGLPVQLAEGETGTQGGLTPVWPRGRRQYWRWPPELRLCWKGFAKDSAYSSLPRWRLGRCLWDQILPTEPGAAGGHFDGDPWDGGVSASG